MYLVGKGADVMGPGTSTVQRIDWTRANEAQTRGLGSVPEFRDDRAMMTQFRGMGCGCDCNKGMGFFESGMDVSTWGPLEWAAVGLGGYMVLSTVFTTRRAISRVRALPGEARAAGRRARRRVGRRIAGE